MSQFTISYHCQGTQRRRQIAPSQTSVTAENMQDFIFDPNEAYAYYLNFVKVSINDNISCTHQVFISALL